MYFAIYPNNNITIFFSRGNNITMLAAMYVHEEYIFYTHKLFYNIFTNG